MVELPQTALWCRCGRERINARGSCSQCERRVRLSKEDFGGLREQVIERDGGRAQCCGSLDDLIVHHRRPGRNLARYMVTLCRSCHARIHRTLRPAYTFEDALRALWREQHPGLAEQLRLPLAPYGQLYTLDETVRQAALFEIGLAA